MLSSSSPSEGHRPSSEDEDSREDRRTREATEDDSQAPLDGDGSSPSDSSHDLHPLPPELEEAYQSLPETTNANLPLGHGNKFYQSPSDTKSLCIGDNARDRLCTKSVARASQDPEEIGNERYSGVRACSWGAASTHTAASRIASDLLLESFHIDKVDLTSAEVDTEELRLCTAGHWKPKHVQIATKRS